MMRLRVVPMACCIGQAQKASVLSILKAMNSPLIMLSKGVPTSSLSALQPFRFGGTMVPLALACCVRSAGAEATSCTYRAVSPISSVVPARAWCTSCKQHTMAGSAMRSFEA